MAAFEIEISPDDLIIVTFEASYRQLEISCVASVGFFDGSGLSDRPFSGQRSIVLSLSPDEL